MSLLKPLRELNRRYMLFRNGRLEQYDLTGYQGYYITAICKTPGISQEELAELLIFNKSSIARQAALLEEKGYLLRRRSEKDKRVLLLFPTEKATAALPAVHAAMRDFREYITDGFSQEELALFERMSQKMNLRAKEVLAEYEKDS